MKFIYLFIYFSVAELTKNHMEKRRCKAERVGVIAKIGHHFSEEDD